MDVFELHERGWPSRKTIIPLGMPKAGVYHWRDGGEAHVNDPAGTANFQGAVREKNRFRHERSAALFASLVLQHVFHSPYVPPSTWMVIPDPPSPRNPKARALPPQAIISAVISEPIQCISSNLAQRPIAAFGSFLTTAF